MEGSEGWKRIPDFFAAAGDIQAKPTRVSGGFDLLVSYIFRLVCQRTSLTDIGLTPLVDGKYLQDMRTAK